MSKYFLFVACLLFTSILPSAAGTNGAITNAVKRTAIVASKFISHNSTADVTAREELRSLPTRWYIARDNTNISCLNCQQTPEVIWKHPRSSDENKPSLSTYLNTHIWKETSAQRAYPDNDLKKAERYFKKQTQCNSNSLCKPCLRDDSEGIYTEAICSDCGASYVAPVHKIDLSNYAIID